MELKEILAVSGQPGLFRYLARNSGGVIVESLTDKRRTIFPSNARVSSLAEIAIFTDDEDVPLAQVFEKLYAHTAGKPTISHKADPKQIEELISTVLPGYDRERVHHSDLKKLVMWFNILVEAGMTEFKLPDEASEASEATPATASAKASKPAESAVRQPKIKEPSAARTPAKAQRPRPKV
jgi:hypothetical protein